MVVARISDIVYRIHHYHRSKMFDILGPYLGADLDQPKKAESRAHLCPLFC
jgi:hypothetical protein